MPETTPLIKAALNLRVGAGFDVYETQGNRPMFLTCNHFAVIYKNKAESLFTSLPPFIIIEDLRIYRVFFTHSISG